MLSDLIPERPIRSLIIVAVSLSYPFLYGTLLSGSLLFVAICCLLSLIRSEVKSQNEKIQKGRQAHGMQAIQNTYRTVFIQRPFLKETLLKAPEALIKILMTLKKDQNGKDIDEGSQQIYVTALINELSRDATPQDAEYIKAYVQAAHADPFHFAPPITPFALMRQRQQSSSQLAFSQSSQAEIEPENQSRPSTIASQ